VHGPTDLRRSLAEGDIEALTLVPGVGRKTAARLLIELKSRLDLPALAPSEAAALVNGDAGRSSRADLRDALAGLGYETDEVGAVLRELPADGEVEDLLRQALRLLAAAR
jgi:Holliday junction DNA helicase RuvA